MSIVVKNFASANWAGSKKGIHDCKSCSYPSKETFNERRPKLDKERKKERESMLNDKRGNDSILKNWEMELLKNGNVTRTPISAGKKKRNGGAITDSIERRRWGLE